MKQNIAIAALLGLGCLIIWAFLDLHLNTKQRIGTTQRLLEGGCSLDELENAIGGPTREFSTAEIPEYLKSKDDFREREGTIVREYNKEGFPYWWVHVQVKSDDFKIVWYSVAER